MDKRPATNPICRNDSLGGIVTFKADRRMRPRVNLPQSEIQRRQYLLSIYLSIDGSMRVFISVRLCYGQADAIGSIELDPPVDRGRSAANKRPRGRMRARGIQLDLYWCMATWVVGHSGRDIWRPVFDRGHHRPIYKVRRNSLDDSANGPSDVIVETAASG